MSVVQTVLLYGAVPVALFMAIALLAAGRGLSRRPRYRPGERWRYPPVWWSANPEGAALPEPGASSEPGAPAGEDDGVEGARRGGVPAAEVSRGGAHGGW